MDSEREKQEFNFAVSDLNRVNLLCAAIEDAMMNMQSFEWFTSLQTLSATLSPYMKDEELADLDKRLENIWDSMQKSIKRNQQKGTNEMSRQTYKDLKDIYVRLRRVQKDSQLLGKAQGDFLEPENW